MSGCQVSKKTLHRKDIETCVLVIQKLMGLDHYDIEVSWLESSENLAGTRSAPEYQKATISFNLDDLGLKSYKRKVVHEMFHVWISAMTQSVDCVLDKRQKKLYAHMEETMATAFEKWPVWGGNK